MQSLRAFVVFCLVISGCGGGELTTVETENSGVSSVTIAPGGFIGPFQSEHTNSSDMVIPIIVKEYLIKPDDTVDWYDELHLVLQPEEIATIVHVIKVALAEKEGEYTVGLVLIDSGGNQTKEDYFNFTVELPSYVNSLEMNFKLINAGEFVMGSPIAQVGRDDDESEHVVGISNSYYMQTTEVTQKTYTMVMKINPSYWQGCPDCPVETVSWYDAQRFIGMLNNLDEGVYRLPTEAEWEFAARAGSKTAFANGAITETGCEYDPILDEMGAYCGNTTKTIPVAQKEPNGWGLYDMHGNVWEWCEDWYGYNYPSHYSEDPAGPPSGRHRVFRGGTYFYDAKSCRSANRGSCPPNKQKSGRGFRVVREL